MGWVGAGMVAAASMTKTGRTSVSPDGQWIITMGSFGFVGFVATFGLLAVPIFCAARGAGQSLHQGLMSSKSRR